MSGGSNALRQRPSRTGLLIPRCRKKRKTVSLGLILCVLLLPSSASSLEVWGCDNQYRDGATDREEAVSPTWIETEPGVAGIIQTPNFPNHFPLPLQCVWVFNNTLGAAADGRQRYVHVYFTQFYLSQGFVTLSELSRREWPLSEGGRESRKLSWNQIRTLGRRDAGDFGTRHARLMSNNSYVVVLLNVTRQSYDLLHKRVLEVSGSYGFNITFETSFSRQGRRQSCSLKNCNLNGECYSSPYNHTALRGFFCKCTYPRSAPTETEPFQGDQCQYLTKGSCSMTWNDCLNGGKCNYLTSRYVQCQCPEGWAGTKCEKRVEDQSSKVCRRGGHQAKWQVPFGNINKTYSLINEFLSKADYHHPALGKVGVYKSGFISSSGSSFIVIQTEVCLDLSILWLLKSWLSQLPSLGNISLQQSPFKITAMASDTGRFVFEEKDFQISCSVFGVDRPVFRMLKGPYQVNGTLAYRNVRYISLDARQDGDQRWNGVLLMTNASVWDDGVFHCRVYDVGPDPVPGDDRVLGAYPMISTKVGTRIVVVTRPKVEVFPLSTTLIKDNTPSYKYGVGDNALHCFASSEASIAAPRNYVFSWKKNRRPIEPKNNSTVEYLEEMGVEGPPGLTLKLGRISSGSVYTCEVYDRREKSPADGRRKFVTRVDVHVNVADSVRDTCSDGVMGMIVWPRTMRGKTASTTCYRAKGHLSRRCDPTNPQNAPQWSERQNESQCIRKEFLDNIHEIERLFRGYAESRVDYNFPSVFLRNITKVSESRPPSIAEWRENVKIIWQLLDYIQLKPDLGFDYEMLLVDFYSETLPWLSGKVEDVGRMEDEKESVLEIFRLVNKSVPLFGSRIPTGRPFVIPYHLEMHSNHVSDDDEGSRCFDYPLYVKLVRWKPSTGMKTLEKGDTGGGRNGSCPGRSRVRVTVGESRRETLVAVIHYKELESVVEGGTTAELTYSKNSSMVTVLVDANRDTPLVNVSVKFYDFVFPTNDSSSPFSNLTCGRVEMHPSFRLVRKDPGCELLWQPDGVTCLCTKPGTYAIVRSTRRPRDVDQGQMGKQPNAIPYCCAGSLAMCFITLMVVLKNFTKQPGTWIHLVQAQVSLLASGVMVSIILVVAEFIEEDHYHIINAALQFMLLSSVTCQLVTVLHNYHSLCRNALRWKGDRRAWMVGSALGTLVLPAAYCIALVGLIDGPEVEEVHDGHRHRSSPSRSWFLQKTGVQFFLFVFANLLLCLASTFLGFLSVRRVTKKRSRKLSPVKQSLWMIFALGILQIGLFFYVNRSFAQVYLALPCFAVGFALFCCYVVLGGDDDAAAEGEEPIAKLPAAAATKRSDDARESFNLIDDGSKSLCVVSPNTVSCRYSKRSSSRNGPVSLSHLILSAADQHFPDVRIVESEEQQQESSRYMFMKKRPSPHCVLDVEGGGSSCGSGYVPIDPDRGRRRRRSRQTSTGVESSGPTTSSEPESSDDMEPSTSSFGCLPTERRHLQRLHIVRSLPLINQL